jgi:hypothetical protein
MFERTLRVQSYADRSQLDEFFVEFKNSPGMVSFFVVHALHRKGIWY